VYSPAERSGRAPVTGDASFYGTVRLWTPLLALAGALHHRHVLDRTLSTGRIRSQVEQPDSQEVATVDLSDRCVGNSYILMRRIGQGATGTVWRAIDRATGEEVAVKLLREHLVSSPKLVSRFVQERTILLMLRHNNIVRVRDLFTAGESLGLVMDLVVGGSLREHLQDVGTLPADAAARLLAQVAAAVAEAHRLGIVHRDLKPDNVLLHRDGDRIEPQLTDFGVARILDAPGLTTPDHLLGTPHYMAPEAINGTRPGPPVDVYALGVMLYELIVGRSPYTGSPVAALLRRHVDDRPERPPGLPDPVWTVITSCMDKDPQRRPAAADLTTTLTSLARATAGIAALPPPKRTDSDGASRGSTSLRPRPSHTSTALPPRRPPPRPRNRPRFWRWALPALGATLAAGALVAAAATGRLPWTQVDGSSQHAAGGTPPQGEVQVVPRQPDRASEAGGPAAGPTPSVGPAREIDGLPRAARGARPPALAVDSHLSVGATSGPMNAGAHAKVYGPWQCGDAYQWDIGHPALANPCYAVGGAIRVMGRMEATPGVQADVSLSVEDVGTGRRVAGPYTCDGLMFTDFAPEHTCGPFDLDLAHGHRYRVVQSWAYTGRGLLPGGSIRGPEFAW
jgi:serine/threonine-protein kinase